MNEPPEPVLLLPFRVLLWPSRSVTGMNNQAAAIYCSLWIISSGLHRRVRKFSIVGPYAFSSGLSAHTGHGNGDHAGTDYIHTKGFDNIRAGHLRTSRRPYDPAPATTFSHLDATTVLSRKISELGIYPAVDPLDSTSRILSPISSARIIMNCKETERIAAAL